MTAISAARYPYLAGAGGALARADRRSHDRRQHPGSLVHNAYRIELNGESMRKKKGRKPEDGGEQ